MGLLTIVTWLLLSYIVSASSNLPIAIVAFDSPASLTNTFYHSAIGAFSPAVPSISTPIEGTLALSAEDDTGNYFGCHYSPLDLSDQIAIIRRGGNCSFVNKVLWAQKQGAKAAVIVNQPLAGELDGTFIMGGQNNSIAIPSLMISEQDGDPLFSMLGQTVSETIRIRIYQYQLPGFDWNMILLFVMAVGTVIGGAYYSSVKERAFFEARSKGLPPPTDFDEDEEALHEYVTLSHAACFIVAASTSLITLYFLIDYLIYFLIGFFAFAGTFSLTGLLQSLIVWRFKPTSSHQGRPTGQQPHWLFQTIIIPYIDESIPLLSLICLAPCGILAICWVIYRNSSSAFTWIMQDTFGISLLFLIQKSLRLPNMQVSSVLLCMAFFYDIFWVFFSARIFSSSVMVTVATGGDTGENVPMLLRVPRFNTDFGGHDSMLGLGDIALPGLFISFLRRLDYSLDHDSFCRGYFWFGAIGYTVGLVITYAALIISKTGQPALLYLVPATVGLTCVIAYRRNQLGVLWKGVQSESHEGGLHSTIEETQSSGHWHRHSNRGSHHAIALDDSNIEIELDLHEHFDEDELEGQSTNDILDEDRLLQGVNTSSDRFNNGNHFTIDAYDSSEDEYV